VVVVVLEVLVVVDDGALVVVLVGAVTVGGVGTVTVDDAPGAVVDVVDEVELVEVDDVEVVDVEVGFTVLVGRGVSVGKSGSVHFIWVAGVVPGTVVPPGAAAVARVRMPAEPGNSPGKTTRTVAFDPAASGSANTVPVCAVPTVVPGAVPAGPLPVELNVLFVKVTPEPASLLTATTYWTDPSRSRWANVARPLAPLACCSGESMLMKSWETGYGVSSSR
jgi:hypothetical protein